MSSSSAPSTLTGVQASFGVLGPRIDVRLGKRLGVSRKGSVRFSFRSSSRISTGIVSLRTEGRARDLILGSTSFRRSQGGSLVVRVTLTAAGRRAIKRGLKARATVIVRDAAGNASVKQLRFTLVRAGS